MTRNSENEKLISAKIQRRLTVWKHENKAKEAAGNLNISLHSYRILKRKRTDEDIGTRNNNTGGMDFNVGDVLDRNTSDDVHDRSTSDDGHDKSTSDDVLDGSTRDDVHDRSTSDDVHDKSTSDDVLEESTRDDVHDRSTSDDVHNRSGEILDECTDNGNVNAKSSDNIIEKKRKKRATKVKRLKVKPCNHYITPVFNSNRCAAQKCNKVWNQKTTTDWWGCLHCDQWYHSHLCFKKTLN